MQLKIEYNITLVDGLSGITMVFVCEILGRFLLISESLYTEDILKELKNTKKVVLLPLLGIQT